jgi:hypothetical protein
MANLKINGLRPMTNQAGITSWYWRPSKTLLAAGWQAMALGKDKGQAIVAAEKRNAEVAAWKNGAAMPGGAGKRGSGGTVGALVALYRRQVIGGKCAATDRAKIKAKTQATYETSLKRIEAWAGEKSLAWVTPKRIGTLRDKMAPPPERGGIGHAAAFNLLKQLRQLFAFAEAIDLIPKNSNPATAFGLGAPPPRAIVWEGDDEAAFTAAAYDLGLPSLALALELGLYTAQREADLLGFTEGQYQALEIDPAVRARFADPAGLVMGWNLAQSKGETGKARVRLEIPFEASLRRKVEAALAANRARDRAAEPRRLLTHVIVDDRTGLPFKQRAFIAAWSAVLAHAATATGRAHMRELVWHDLRRTRVVRLRRRGMVPAAIASITGHSPESIAMMLKVYGPIDPTMTAAALASSLEEAA